MKKKLSLMSEITLFQWVSISFGLIGTILGITNFIRVLIAESFRLKVTPGIYEGDNDGNAKVTSISKLPNKSNSGFRLDDLIRNGKLAVTITNLSKFPVYLSNIGILSADSVEPLVLHKRFYKNEEKLEPRKSVTIYTNTKELSYSSYKRKVKVYVNTQCGREVKASSPAFKRWIKQDRAY